ncbi:MAG TPA: hypothetical protein VFN67_43220 [Polyangiales bacterium]|nr:hypothetical protein [Polyangiales bacterium]
MRAGTLRDYSRAPRRSICGAITALSQREGQVLTYNIEVDAYHNYFAEGLLVLDR